MATDRHIQRLEQGYEPVFINMFVVRGHFVVAADGSRSRVELKYGATGDSQHAIIRGGGYIRDLTPNWSVGLRSGAEHSGTHK